MLKPIRDYEDIPVYTPLSLWDWEKSCLPVMLIVYKGGSRHGNSRDNRIEASCADLGEDCGHLPAV